MEVLFFIIVIVVILILVANSGSSTKSTTLETELQRQARIRREREQQEERERQARLQRENEQKEQTAREAEQGRLAEQRARQQQELAQAEQQRQQRIARERLVQEEQQRQRDQQNQLQYYENNTIYSSQLNHCYQTNPRAFSITSIRNISNSFCNSLTEQERNRLFAELNQGVAILMTEGHLHVYMRSYGNMHQAKLQQSFQTVINHNHLSLNGQNIQVIDYGCGQGIGTICFIDYLKANTNFNCTISKVRLIEPSEKALKRAALNVRYSLRSANQNENVYACRKELDDITNNDLSTDDNSIKVHIFSNIIDVNDFDLNTLCSKINSTQKGTNYFICVSPKFWEDGVHPRNVRLDTFMNYFQSRHDVSVISRRESNINSWKRYERVFKTNIGNVTNGRTRQAVINSYIDDDLPF